MPSVALKLKHHAVETVDVNEVEVEVSFDQDDPEIGNFAFSTRIGEDDTYCFTLTKKGMEQLILFYEQIKK